MASNLYEKQLDLFPDDVSVFIGEKALAEILGVSIEKVREDRVNEEGVSCLAGNSRPRYRREDVIAYINQLKEG